MNRIFAPLGSMNKWAAYRPSPRHFIHTDPLVSNRMDCFNKIIGYSRGRSSSDGNFFYGINKYLGRASGKGILIDEKDTGKSDA